MDSLYDLNEVEPVDGGSPIDLSVLDSYSAAAPEPQMQRVTDDEPDATQSASGDQPLAADGVAEQSHADDALSDTTDSPVTDWQARASEVQEQLEELQAEVALRLNAPVADWDGLAQVRQMPQGYQDKLLMGMLTDSLPEFVNAAINAPDDDPRAAQALPFIAQMAVEAVSAWHKRPVDEWDGILRLTSGMSVDQIRGLLEVADGRDAAQLREALNGQAAYDVNAPVGAVAKGLIEEGFPADHPLVRQALQLESATRNTSQQSVTLQNSFNQLKAELDGLKTAESQRASQAAMAAIDSRRESAQRDALTAELKRVPEASRAAIESFVLPRLQAEITANQKAQDALKLAQGFQSSGVEAKAIRQMNVYSALVQQATQRIVTEAMQGIMSNAETLRAADSRKLTATPLLTTPAGGNRVAAAQSPSAGIIANMPMKTREDVEAALAAVLG